MRTGNKTGKRNVYLLQMLRESANANRQESAIFKRLSVGLESLLNDAKKDNNLLKMGKEHNLFMYEQQKHIADSYKDLLKRFSVALEKILVVHESEFKNILSTEEFTRLKALTSFAD